MQKYSGVSPLPGPGTPFAAFYAGVYDPFTRLLPKGERQEAVMSRKIKRTLSLVLALVMICSTMSFMAFAQESANLYGPCKSCRRDQNFTRRYEDFLNRVIECPLHNGVHDTEEWYIEEIYTCDVCGWEFTYDSVIEYRCLI